MLNKIKTLSLIALMSEPAQACEKNSADGKKPNCYRGAPAEFLKKSEDDWSRKYPFVGIQLKPVMKYFEQNYEAGFSQDWFVHSLTPKGKYYPIMAAIAEKLVEKQLPTDFAKMCLQPLESEVSAFHRTLKGMKDGREVPAGAIFLESPAELPPEIFKKCSVAAEGEEKDQLGQAPANSPSYLEDLILTLQNQLDIEMIGDPGELTQSQINVVNRFVTTAQANKSSRSAVEEVKYLKFSQDTPELSNTCRFYRKQNCGWTVSLKQEMTLSEIDALAAARPESLREFFKAEHVKIPRSLSAKQYQSLENLASAWTDKFKIRSFSTDPQRPTGFTWDWKTVPGRHLNLNVNPNEPAFDPQSLTESIEFFYWY